MQLDEILQPLDDIYVRDGFCDWADVANARDEIRRRLESAPSPIPAPGVVKPLDLSTLLRDAFLSGRGLKDGDKLSNEDHAAWMDYDPERMNAYRRISAALASISQPAKGEREGGE